MGRDGMQVYHQDPDFQDLAYQAFPRGSQPAVAVREESRTIPKLDTTPKWIRCSKTISNIQEAVRGSALDELKYVIKTPNTGR